MTDKKSYMDDPMMYFLAVVEGMEFILNKLGITKEGGMKQSLLGRSFKGMSIGEVQNIIAQETVDMILTKYERRK